MHLASRVKGHSKLSFDLFQEKHVLLHRLTSETSCHRLLFCEWNRSPSFSSSFSYPLREEKETVKWEKDSFNAARTWPSTARVVAIDHRMRVTFPIQCDQNHCMMQHKKHSIRYDARRSCCLGFFKASIVSAAFSHRCEVAAILSRTHHCLLFFLLIFFPLNLHTFGPVYSPYEECY